MKVEVLNINGEATGKTVELSDDIFGIEPNDHAIYLAVKQYLANQRQGTHKTKERAEITGSTKKLKRQKGTGTARAGSIKSPLFRGGGRAFGPRPRSYDLKVNKKVKILAKHSALSQKAQSDGIKVIEDFSFDSPKTKEYINVLKSLGVEGQKTLLIAGKQDKNVALSARNIPRTLIRGANNISTYEVLNAQTILITESALESLS